MGKGNTRTIVGIIVLLVVVALAVILSDDESSAVQSFDEYEGDFAVENIEDVSRIVLTRRGHMDIELRKTRDGWFVNDQYRARSSSVEPLLEVIQYQEIEYIPPKAALEHINWDIAAHGIQVDVYGNKNDLLKSYYVGGANANESGTHVRMANSDQPFVTGIPMMDGSFRARLELTLDDWRDRHFMTIDPDDVRQISVEYPNQKSQSFVLKINNGNYAVTPMFPDLRDYGMQYRKGTGDQYFNAFMNLACEAYDNNYPGIDSFRAMVPFSSIEVTMKDTSDNFTMDLYPMGQRIVSEFSPPVHRLFIDKVPGDFLLVQYEVIKGILRGYDFFFEGVEHELVL